ncbi:MAG: glycoside hydrolase family 104 protein [Burkholderiaceae bacterium]
MRPSTLALIALACFAGFSVLAHYQAASSADQAEASTDGDSTDDGRSPWASVDLYGITTAAIESNTVTQALTTDTNAINVAAFLTMLAKAEGTEREPDPYRVCYGYKHVIEDLSEHPAITREWMGEDISSLGPQYAGKVSTAAGRYQMIRPTWIGCRNALRLTDFGPTSQDLAAVYLIKQRGALEDVQAGRVQDAIDKLTRAPALWASLPGGGDGQPQRKLALLLDAFDQAGGIQA